MQHANYPYLDEEGMEHDLYEGYGVYPEEDMETLYIYVSEDDPEKPHQPRLSPHTRGNIVTLGGLAFLFLCIVGIYLGVYQLLGQPAYTIQTLTLPAQVSTQAFQASAAIIPTGKQTYPATKAHGLLTIYNGSVFLQSLPAGFTISTPGGIDIATDQAVTIPKGTPPMFGETTVSAHAVLPGASGNLAPYAVQATYGSDIEIKNLSGFTGGQDAYTKTYATGQDREKALQAARQQLAITRPVGLLAHPCTETVKQTESSVVVSWQCQYVLYQAPTNGQVISVQVSGNHVMVKMKIIQSIANTDNVD